MAEFRKNNFIFPDFKNSNLAVLKEALYGKGTRTGNKKKKIFLVLDGFGYNLLSELLLNQNGEDFLKNAKIERLTTLFPSTTTTILTSFETGVTPAEHGIIGWNVFVKEIGSIIMPYRDAQTVSKEFVLSKIGFPGIIPKPDLFIKVSGKKRLLFMHDESIKYKLDGIVNSGDVDHASFSDMFVKLRKTIKEARYDFVYVYCGLVDHMEHLYGKGSEEVRQQVLSFFTEFERILLRDLIASDYNLIITADHGQIEIDKRINIDSKSEIMDYLVNPPWGDARVAYLNVIPGKEKSFKRFFEKKYGNLAILAESDTVIKTGIFGKLKVNEQIRSRFGSHIIIMTGRNIIKYKYPVLKIEELKAGTHSGLSEDEMYIPLIVY